MKCKGILWVIVCCVISFSGCSNFETPKIHSPKPSISTPLETIQEQVKAISPLILDTEENIKAYLVGDWIFNQEYVSSIVCNMTISEDLLVNLQFQDTLTNVAKGEYTGKIVLDRIYAKPSDAPDLITMELMDASYPGGDFFFTHRTIYGDKRVMSWFFAGNGNCIFDLLGPEGFESSPDEIIFEATNSEVTEHERNETGEFFGVYWGMGDDNKSLWIDDVLWTPPEKEDYAPMYPLRYTHYENIVKESVLYSISKDDISEVLGDDLFPGQVYLVRTDYQNQIIEMVDPEFETFFGDADNEYRDTETAQLVMDIMNSEVEIIKEHLNAGMSILYTEETIILDEQRCYLVSLGTDHEEHFVNEFFYAVNTWTREIYEYDPLLDAWKIMAKG